MWVTRAALSVCLLAVSVSASAASKAELEERIVQIERKLDSRGLVDLMEQMKSLQRDLQKLRGNIEVQTHNIESMQKRQRELYVDIDRRMHRLESASAGGFPGNMAPTQSSGMSGTGFPVTTMSNPSTSSADSAMPGAAVDAVALTPPSERRDYDAALEILKQGRYNEAASAFQGFLKKYPGSSYADNAQYWLGEVYYVTRQFPAALTEFNTVLNKYADSSKVADAQLKIGYIQYEMKQWTEARDALNRVVQGYPGTTSSRLAQERLDRIQREGN